MALFKLFSSRKKTYIKHQDNICEKVLTFSNNQLRVIFFRECDFRGRKLLFDSHSITKIPLTGANAEQTLTQNGSKTNTKNQEKFMEISNGLGYMYNKPNTDINQLGEMVFGTVAMSYRGTSLKIHSLSSPSRLMYTQIFPSPRHSSRVRCSAPSGSYVHSSTPSTQSFEHSIRLDDSGASSANSIGSDHLSVNSTSSDTVLVCRGTRSVPLDVPSPKLNNNNLSPSYVMDSGFCGDQSMNSISSGPQSLPLWEENCSSVAPTTCGSFYKRWLRSTSTSLDHSNSSLAGSTSTDECVSKSHSRNSKLGLAVLINLSAGQEQQLEQFLMEHVVLMESALWKARQGAEIAYIRPSNFISLMCDVVNNIEQWFMAFVSGPQLASHMWISLAPVCDNLYSINNSCNIVSENMRQLCGSEKSLIKSDTLTGSLNSSSSKNKSDKSVNKNDTNLLNSNSFASDITVSSETADSNEFNFFNLSKLLRTEWESVGVKKSFACNDTTFAAEKFLKDLCELLETLDVKHTNFFVSTLVTAVLTHHLGWVTTVLPPTCNEKESVAKLDNPCNPLWGQLSDLYGAIGHPTKVAQTVIAGSNKSDQISKILNSLTYFIRCSDVERKCLVRLDIDEENKQVDCICKEKACIPKENYKKYEDHLREIESSDDTFTKMCDIKLKEQMSNRFKDFSDKVSDNTENIEMQNLNTILLNNNKISNRKNCQSKNNVISNPSVVARKLNALVRTNTCFTALNKIEDETYEETSTRIYPCLDDLHKAEKIGQKMSTIETRKSSDPEIQSNKFGDENSKIQAATDKPSCFTNAEINEKVRKLCRVPTSAILYHLEKDSEEDKPPEDIKVAHQHPHDFSIPKKQNVEKQMKSQDISLPNCDINSFHKPDQSLLDQQVLETNTNWQEKIISDQHDGVIFVLGDNEKLVGLKKVNSNSSFKNMECKKLDGVTDEPQTSQEVDNKSKRILSRPTTLNLSPEKPTNKFYCASSDSSEEDILIKRNIFANSEFCDSDFAKYEGEQVVKPSTSWTPANIQNDKTIVTNHSTIINLESVSPTETNDLQHKQEFTRSQSVPPETSETNTDKSQTRSKYRYSGVKFNFQQYPQIVTNYMRSKNLEIPQLAFEDKAMKLDGLTEYPNFDFSNCDGDLEEVETLQTPSNASELEFTSELVTKNYEEQHAKEKIERKAKIFTRNHLPNTIIAEVEEPNCQSSSKRNPALEHPLKINDKANNAMFEHEESAGSEEEYTSETKSAIRKMQIVELPMPKSEIVTLPSLPAGYTSSLMRGLGNHYLSNMVLQGTSAPSCEWESALKKDLTLAARHPVLDQPVDEAVAIVANTDKWEVHLLSSHTYVVDRGSSGVRVGMSQLVSNMLESLLHMWRLHTPPEYCLLHIEQRLQEFCTLSKALAQLLLASEFCSMELLTSALQLEVNDVPLLMAVASTHSPQVTQKYGLSFQ